MCPGAVVGRHLRPWRKCAAGLERSGAIVGVVLRGWSFGQGCTYLSVTTLNSPKGPLPTSSRQRRPHLHPHSPTPASSGSAIRRQPRPRLAGRCHRCRSLPPGAPAAPTSPTENSRGAWGEAAIARTGAHPHITRPKNGAAQARPHITRPRNGAGLIEPDLSSPVRAGECGVAESGNHSQKKRWGSLAVVRDHPWEYPFP
jgi:hypothetical protein